MNKTGNIALILCILIIISIIVDKIFFKQKEIAVIQLQELVYDYKGMKEATAAYTLKMNKWNAQGDSLESRLKSLLDDMKLDSINHDNKKLIQDQQSFIYLRKSFYDFKEKTEKQAKDEDKEMTAGVMNQLSEHIKAYAIKEGYDVIIKNDQSQQIGYVNEATDVTKKLIEFANKRYESGN